MSVQEDAALARKRRMEQRRSSVGSDSLPAAKKVRLEYDGNVSTSEDCDNDNDCNSVVLSSDHEDEDGHTSLPSIRGIKKQSRYEPGVPMTKEELQKWRKAARRVRNRESAAASRAKTRDRIAELEAQVSELQSLLLEAKARIAELEEEKGPRSSPLPTVSPISSPKSSSLVTHLDQHAPLTPDVFSLDCSRNAPLNLVASINPRPTAV